MPAVLGRDRKNHIDIGKEQSYKEYPDPSVDEIIYGITEYEGEYLKRDQVTHRQEVFERSHPDLVKADEHKRKIEKKRLRQSARKRLFEAVVSIGLIVLVGFFVYLLLYPQAELSEISRDNSDLKDEIATLKKQTIDSEEQLNGISDMESIRAQALALGMQDPNANQVVSLPMPTKDKLVTVVTYDDYGVSEDAYYTSLSNLAEYYTMKSAGVFSR